MAECKCEVTAEQNSTEQLLPLLSLSEKKTLKIEDITRQFKIRSLTKCVPVINRNIDH